MNREEFEKCVSMIRAIADGKRDFPIDQALADAVSFITPRIKVSSFADVATRIKIVQVASNIEDAIRGPLKKSGLDGLTDVQKKSVEQIVDLGLSIVIGDKSFTDSIEFQEENDFDIDAVAGVIDSCSELLTHLVAVPEDSFSRIGKSSKLADSVKGIAASLVSVKSIFNELGHDYSSLNRALDDLYECYYGAYSGNISIGEFKRKMGVVLDVVDRSKFTIGASTPVSRTLN